MKTKFYSFLVFLLLAGISVQAGSFDRPVAEGNSLTDLGSYTVIKSDVPMVVKEATLETYDLLYENASNPVRIGVLQEKNCTTFLVKTGEVEVQYVCRKGKFGARKMATKYRTAELRNSDSKLNQQQVKAQQVISTSIEDEEAMLGLIACYLPSLIEEKYQARL